MRNFPLHTALTIITFGLMLAGARLVVPAIKGPELSHFRDIIALPSEPKACVSPSRNGSEAPPPSTTARPLPVLFDDSQGSLDRFYWALSRSERREPGAVTRIIHYGDSPTTSDLITGDIRSLLQRHFGDAGHGFVLADNPWAWYHHAGVKVFGLGWRMLSASRFDADDGMFGLGGVTFSGSPPAHTTIRLERTVASQIEICFLEQPDGGDFTVSAGGHLLGRTSTAGDSKSAGFAVFHVEPPAVEVSVHVAEGNVRWFGLISEGPGPGVVYDSLGLNGGSITVLARMFNQAHWTEQLRHRRPDLIVINYGTNEAGFAGFIEREYEGELKEAIRRIRRAVPNSSVLIMSPMDRGQRTPSGDIETMPTIPKLVEIQRRVARETGSAFFDTFDAMGGEGTMARWYDADPRLVAADLIHPFGDGGRIVASLFTKEILAGLARFKHRQEMRDPSDGTEH
jgi:lysophospholipase L1-like esterase